MEVEEEQEKQKKKEKGQEGSSGRSNFYINDNLTDKQLGPRLTSLTH